MSYVKPTLNQEMTRFLRNSDIFTTTERGVTTYTENGTFSDTSTHALTNNPTKLKNVRYVKIGGNTLKYGFDYSTDLVNGKVEFLTAKTGEYEIKYDSGTNDKIYGDYPRDDLSLSAFPRIAIGILSDSDDAFGIGGNSFITDTLFTIKVYSESQDYIESKVSTLKKLLRDNAKSFFNSPFIKPIGRGPIIKYENKNQVLLQSNVDCRASFQIERA